VAQDEQDLASSGGCRVLFLVLPVCLVIQDEIRGFCVVEICDRTRGQVLTLFLRGQEPIENPSNDRPIRQISLDDLLNVGVNFGNTSGIVLGPFPLLSSSGCSHQS
jgi:hypothetical protein